MKVNKQRRGYRGAKGACLERRKDCRFRKKPLKQKRGQAWHQDGDQEQAGHAQGIGRLSDHWTSEAKRQQCQQQRRLDQRRPLREQIKPGDEGRARGQRGEQGAGFDGQNGAKAGAQMAEIRQNARRVVMIFTLLH